MLTFKIPSFKRKPYTAITVQVDRMTSGQYDADDMSGIPDLIEVIRLQAEGPVEAARAIRKKLKYGNVHQQLRALTVLDGLIENAGPHFQRVFADERLLERLRVCGTDGLSDPEVKKKCTILFRQWALTYQTTPYMERLVALHKQLPQRKKPVRQDQSRVIRETERDVEQDPFGNNDYQEVAPSNNTASKLQRSPLSLSSASALSQGSPLSVKGDKSRAKRSSNKPFNLEKAKPQLLQAIASSSLASTNLMNALKLINREHKRVGEDPEAVKRFENCKLLRRQVLRYIQVVESEQWLGSLIHANDELVTALMAFEVLDKSVEDDSDSEAWESDGHIPGHAGSPKAKSAQQAFAGLSLGQSSVPRVSLNGKEKTSNSDEDESEDESEDEADEDDPFADRNVIHTPKDERPAPNPTYNILSSPIYTTTATLDTSTSLTYHPSAFLLPHQIPPSLFHPTTYRLRHLYQSFSSLIANTYTSLIATLSIPTSILPTPDTMSLLLTLLLLFCLFIFCFRIKAGSRWLHYLRGARPRTPSALESGGFAYKDPFKSGKEGEVDAEVMGMRGKETMLRGGSDGSESPGRVGGLEVWRVD